MIALGLVAGISLWWVSRYDGDAFFHLARVQKLLALHDLSLRSVDEFKDGGLHPGYAFPLWHAAVAVISKLAGVGAPSAFLHLPTVLLPLSFVLVYEAGTTLFASRWAGVATALAEFALLGLASGTGRRLRVDGPAGDGLADAAAAGAARARLHVRPRAVGRAARLDRGRLDRDDARPPELLGAGRDRPRRLPGSCARCSTGATTSGTSAPPWPRSSSRPGLVVAVAPADRARDRLAQPVRGRAEPRLRRLRQRARRLRPAQLPARARALRPRRRDRRRLAAAAAARRLRPPADVGRVRARRDARDLRGHAAAVRLPALRRRDLDLAGAADHRLLAAAVRARRRRARAGGLPAPGAAARGARGRDRAPAGLPRRLRPRPTASSTARRAR